MLISVAVSDGILITPTNSCLGLLDPARIAKLDSRGNHVSGDKPSKEVFLHTAFYETRARTGAVVHLHSPFATAISCQSAIDPDDCIKPITPYVVMRVGRVKRLPYVKPGDPAMGTMIHALKGAVSAVLLANHGPVVAGPDLRSAVFAAEELEETAKLMHILKNVPHNVLDEAQIEDLRKTFSH
ncbi:aldolase [Bradyrhizobium sp. MOS001]|nr:3-oxo-tetronate 4-phosphate decarboxylase [Bradyrhizobium sp. MOS001]TFW54396.1 aldolase [Bradyrhizobium sp. MOS001]